MEAAETHPTFADAFTPQRHARSHPPPFGPGNDSDVLWWAVDRSRLRLGERRSPALPLATKPPPQDLPVPNEAHALAWVLAVLTGQAKESQRATAARMTARMSPPIRRYPYRSSGRSAGCLGAIRSARSAFRTCATSSGVGGAAAASSSVPKGELAGSMTGTLSPVAPLSMSRLSCDVVAPGPRSDAGRGLGVISVGSSWRGMPSCPAAWSSAVGRGDVSPGFAPGAAAGRCPVGPVGGMVAFPSRAGRGAARSTTPAGPGRGEASRQRWNIAARGRLPHPGVMSGPRVASLRREGAYRAGQDGNGSDGTAGLLSVP